MPHNALRGHKADLIVVDDCGERMPLTIGQLETELLREKARIYNVPRYYRPTLNMYKNLLSMLDGCLVKRKQNLEAMKDDAELKTILYDRINGLSHQLEKVRQNYGQAITKNKILFQLGKLVILK